VQHSSVAPATTIDVLVSAIYDLQR
jgi:hypothetical protein